MLLSAVNVLVAAQSSSEIPEGLMNNPVYCSATIPKESAVKYRHLELGVEAVPLQAWSDPEGSRKLRFPHVMTMAQEGGKVVSLTHRPHLPRGNPPGTHFC